MGVLHELKTGWRGVRGDLRVMFVIAFLIFVTVSAWAYVADRQREAEHQSEYEELVEWQQELERRLSRIEAGSEKSRHDLQEQITVISEQQREVRENGTGTTSSKAPFPIEEMVNAIVELVCLDNNDREIYYTASGTMVDGGGLLVTNHHNLLSGDGSLIRYCGVGFTDNIGEPPLIEYVAQAVVIHEEADLALLQIREHLRGERMPEVFPAIDVRQREDGEEPLRLGDPIFIAGYPGIGAETFTFTQGVVSGRVGEFLIKTSALIDSGTSGGAAFDADGAYVGVPTAAARGDIGGSLGYLIDIAAVDTLLLEYYSGDYQVTERLSEE
ncbi:hypothetical protein AMJ57_04960 [Parcubacteria bacterium SG8_24]|nr:MAG: hypothetical protein AMJ57_04960 [Parcubacteria bacterium SG8_24]